MHIHVCGCGVVSHRERVESAYQRLRGLHLGSLGSAVPRALHSYRRDLSEVLRLRLHDPRDKLTPFDAAIAPTATRHLA